MVNPLAEYNSIILNRQRNPLQLAEYGEVHHIVPRSCGGCNAKWNLVRLTPEEHYRVHELLPFIYTEGKEHAKMICAWNRMRNRAGEEIDAEVYGQLKREFQRVQSESKIGNSWNKGKRLSEETKQKLSESKKGNTFAKGAVRSDEYRQKMSESCKKHWSTHKRIPWNIGIKHSEETRRKISEAAKRREENKRKEKAA